jgi:hypothetical protein
MTSAGKRRKRKGVPKKRSPKRSPKPARVKRKPKLTAAQRKRSAAAKKGWATRRARAWAARTERDSDLGDVEVQTGDYEPDPEYEPYPLPEIRGDADSEIEFPAAAEAFERMRSMGDHALEAYGEIEWFPRFDEVYDYIDALVDEFDLDAHELFEMAFGYSDEATV